MEAKAKSSEPINETEPPISTAAPTPPPWIELPDELTANILQRLSPEDILESAQEVCTTWWRISKTLPTWRVLELDIDRYGGNDFEMFYTCALNRSQGELTDLKMMYCFKYEDLLEYVVERSSKLLRLKLAEHVGADFANTIKKLPLLEELHLIMSILRPKGFATIGNSCPALKSFTYKVCWDYRLDFEEFEDTDEDSYEDSDEDYYEASEEEFANERNDYGVAIGKSMPNLRHLQLWAVKMTNEGLEAILNGCPHLESLDLRLCFGLDLQGALGKRCVERIKDLRLPSDCTRDIDRMFKPSDADITWEDLKSDYFNDFDSDSDSDLDLFARLNYFRS